MLHSNADRCLKLAVIDVVCVSVQALRCAGSQRYVPQPEQSTLQNPS